MTCRGDFWFQNVSGVVHRWSESDSSRGASRFRKRKELGKVSFASDSSDCPCFITFTSVDQPKRLGVVNQLRTVENGYWRKRREGDDREGTCAFPWEIPLMHSLFGLGWLLWVWRECLMGVYMLCKCWYSTDPSNGSLNRVAACLVRLIGCSMFHIHLAAQNRRRRLKRTGQCYRIMGLVSKWSGGFAVNDDFSNLWLNTHNIVKSAAP